MGCLRRLLVVGVVCLQLAIFALTLLVLGSAGVLGKAAIVSADDAMILFFLNAAALAGTMVLAVALWLGGRARHRQARELATLRSGVPSGAVEPGRQTVRCPRCGTDSLLSVPSCRTCGLERPPTPA